MIIKPIPNGPHPNYHCDIHGCTNPVAFSVENKMTKGRFKGTIRRRVLCKEHAVQFTKKHIVD